MKAGRERRHQGLPVHALGEGGKGIEALRARVVDVADGGQAKFKPLYPDEMPLRDKVKTIATEIYRAADIACDAAIEARFKELQAAGYGHLPVCMAKTQYSFSTDPNRRARPPATSCRSGSCGSPPAPSSSSPSPARS
jgi:formate--tetrahydrofolate ligase